jgi:branched-chain amino acid transport system substrate-binding protein
MYDIDFLSIPLFTGLDRVDVARLVPSLVRLEVKSGEVIIRQGEICESLYILISGTIRKTNKQNDGIMMDISLRGNGECIGIESLLFDAPSSATAVAEEPSILLQLKKYRFDSIIGKHPSIGLHLANVLAKRHIPHLVPNLNTATQVSHHVTLKSHSIFSLFHGLKEHPLAILAVVGLLGMLFTQGMMLIGLTSSQANVSGILFGATVLWGIDVFSYHVVAIALPVIAVVCGIASPVKAFSGFSNPSWFLVLGVFALTAAVSKTGLMYRLILMSSKWFPKGYCGQVFAIAFAGLLLTPVIPSSNGRASLAGPLVQTLCETLKARRDSGTAVGLSMGALLGFGHMSSLFMNGTATCLLGLSLLPSRIAHSISWGQWLYYAIPLGLSFFLLCYLAIIFLYRSTKDTEIDFNTIDSQLKTLGSFTSSERVSVFVIAGTLIAFITQPWHGIQSAWIAMTGLLILVVKNVLSEKNIRDDIDWNFMLSFGAILGFGAIINDSNLADLIAKNLSPYYAFLMNKPFMFLTFIAIFTTLIRFVLPLPAAQLVAILPSVPVGLSMGIHPFIIAQVVMISCNPWFFPYQNSIYINFQQSSEGRMFSHHSVRMFSLWQLFAIVAAIGISIVYWSKIGLIGT